MTKTKSKSKGISNIESKNMNLSINENDERKIRPIVIYPFSHSLETYDFELLFERLLDGLVNDKRFAKPVTVVNRQTHYRASASAQEYRESYKKVRSLINPDKSDIIDAWSVDTCSMWLEGLGSAYDSSNVNDVFWLIPGDFKYSTSAGLSALKKMKKLPDQVYNGDCQLCLGEIEVPLNSPKQLIDTYGTYGLLYNWFPAEAQGIRNITSKPRTEFIAISYEFLKTALIQERWYAYEQTIVILLQNMRGERTVRPVKVEKLGRIEDDPSARSSLGAAMQQIERTERVLKLFWRELNESRHPDKWPDMFRQLDSQSEQIRGAAMTIMKQLLGRK